MRTLELDEKQLALGHELSTPARRKSWAMEMLGLDHLTLNLANRIKALGVTQFCLDMLGMDKKKFNEYTRFSELSKLDKIMMLVEKDTSIRGFFNKAYVAWERFKTDDKGKWKHSKATDDLLIIKSIIDAGLTNDELSEKQAKEIAMRAYMALYKYVSANKQEKESAIAA